MNLKYYNMQDLQIKKFDINNITKHSSVLIISRRESGKTTLCKKIMENLNCDEHVIITHKTQTDYIENDKTKIYTEYNNDIIKSSLETQSNHIDLHGKINSDLCLIIDDSSIFSSVAKDDNFTELMYNSRHYKISLILTNQIPLSMKPDFITNIDYIMLFVTDNMTHIKKMYYDYAGFFKTFDEFHNVFNILTKDYGVMVISNRVKNIYDRVFWYNTLNENEI